MAKTIAVSGAIPAILAVLFQGIALAKALFEDARNEVAAPVATPQPRRTPSVSGWPVSLESGMGPV